MILKNIQTLCEAHKITIAALERKCDIANGVIRYWDVKSPNVANLKKVADYFNVTVDFLMQEHK